MKRILFMHQASSIGGGSYCLLNILKAVDRTKVEPVACLVADGPLREEIENLGFEVIFFPQMQPIPYNKGMWSLSSIRAYRNIPKSIPAFKELLKVHHIDVVYLNNMMIYRYLQPAKECGCKTILHCREHWPLNEHKKQLQWARNAVYKYADELIAINHYSASIFPEKESTIVYDWIDMDSRFEERPMSEILGEDATNLKVYLYTGGVQKIKGAVEVLSSFTKVVKDPNARLLVVGVNPNASISPLKTNLAKIGIKSYFYKVKELIKKDSRIHCVPATYMLAHIMQQCYCNLSYFTIPHANLAMAECEIMGTPSISARNPEAEEYSLNGQLSLLFDANNIFAFEDAIKMFKTKECVFMSNLEKKSYFIKQQFNSQSNIDKLNKVIDKVL